MGAPAPHEGGEKFFFRRNLQGKCVSAPPRTRSAPPSQSRSQFLGQFLLGGLDFEMYLDVLWGRRLKKRSSLFLVRKSAPPDKILATPMTQNKGVSQFSWRVSDCCGDCWRHFVARCALVRTVTHCRQTLLSLLWVCTCILATHTVYNFESVGLVVSHAGLTHISWAKTGRSTIDIWRGLLEKEDSENWKGGKTETEKRKGRDEDSAHLWTM